MIQPSDSSNGIYKAAGSNYERMADCCHILNREGYWDTPEKILGKTIMEMLDLYIQAVLIRLSAYCGRFEEEQKKFILTIPEQNMIALDEGQALLSIVEQAGRLEASPPILLQLCGVRDIEKGSSLTGRFFDSLLNIMLAMAAFHSDMEVPAGKYIQEYYEKIYVFLNDREKRTGISRRYIFRKLSSDWMEDNYTELLGRTRNSRGAEAAAPKEALQEIEKKALPPMEDTDTLEELLAQMDELVGLYEVKKEIRSLINLVKVRKLREGYGMPPLYMTYHMVFAGNPGTGKTTIARFIAKIYRELGILSEGHLVETDRAGLVAGYVGQTALKTKEVVEKAIGGILFIDEAYALTDTMASNDFGREAIDTLVKLMEDNRDNLVVIAAGYIDEMEQFLKSNTGLVSRFNKFIGFPDYSIGELVNIVEAMAEKAGISLTSDARTQIGVKLAGRTPELSAKFGNARGVRNLFEQLIKIQANRLAVLEELKEEDLRIIGLEDVQNL